MSSGATMRTRSSRSSGSGFCSGGGLMLVLGDVDRRRLLGVSGPRECVSGRPPGRTAGRAGVGELARVGDHAGEHGRRRDRGRAEVDLVVGGPAPAREVAVERAKRGGARRRRLSHSDAGPARRLEHPAPPAVRRSTYVPLLVIWSRIWREPGVAVADTRRSEIRLRQQHRADHSQVLVRGVDRGRCRPASSVPATSSDGDDVAGARRLRDQRDERGEVDLLRPRRSRPPSPSRRGEILHASLLVERDARLLVRGEDGPWSPSSAIMFAIAALGVAQRLNAGAPELEDRPAASANAAPAQQLEDDVLCLNPRPPQRVLELDPHDLRARELKRVPGHADGHVEAAGADGDHRAGARLSRVAVGADQRLPGVAKRSQWT